VLKVLRLETFQLFNELVNWTPGKLPSGTSKQKRAGRSLRTLSIAHKSSKSPGVRNQERKVRGRHG